MKSHSQALVHHLLASRLRIDDESIEDTHSFDELGMDPLDLVLVVIRLEDFDRGGGDFPVAALDHARTVGDLVELVDVWLSRDRMPSTIDAPGPQRSSVT
jgi:acyl carrier protein